LPLKRLYHPTARIWYAFPQSLPPLEIRGQVQIFALKSPSRPSLLFCSWIIGLSAFSANRQTKVSTKTSQS